ncbi:MAG: replication-associated recombination protein A [Ezakiella sp.]|nr:replication-associated recombination protein A [Ezakiella sp.]MDD7471617.1 replication-associated recombination protein A [Bacillota bacterium]
MNFFNMDFEKNRESNAPFAERIRPQSFDEVIGQDHILGDKGLIKNAIKTGNLPSLLLYGPPGTGKTTIASLISKSFNMNFIKISAVSSGVKELRGVVDEANRCLENGTKTILFIDEIHRFSTSQQDFLLPYVENGELILIGATTENPFFAVNKALLSRLILVEIKSLTKDDMKKLLERCKQKYFEIYNIKVDIDAKAADFLALRGNGDARRLINSFEVAVLRAFDGESSKITMDVLIDVFSNQVLKYDNADEHYDTISAFIKSMRGSDVDAALFYLAKMIISGEDPRFIARRMVIFASEDIGLADPNALHIATDTFYATTVIGMPEVRINLAHACVYLARAKKDNKAYVAIDKAINFIKKNGAGTVPNHLRDAHYPGSEKLGVGGYKYPHNYEEHYVEQQYLPDEFKDMKFFDREYD